MVKVPSVKTADGGSAASGGERTSGSAGDSNGVMSASLPEAGVEMFSVER